MFGTGGRFNFTGTMDKLLHIAYNRDMSCTRGRGEGRIPHRKEWNVMEELLDALLRECQPYTAHGKVATIPELAKGRPKRPGDLRPAQRWTALPMRLLSQALYHQSVVKPILLLLALLDNGEVSPAPKWAWRPPKPFDAINVTDSPAQRPP